MCRRHRADAADLTVNRSHVSRGQALVEFALILPVLLLLIFGVVDAGRLIFTYNTVSNAARDGARVAIVNQSTTGTNTCDTTVATAYPVGCERCSHACSAAACSASFFERPSPLPICSPATMTVAKKRLS